MLGIAALIIGTSAAAAAIKVGKKIKDGAKIADAVDEAIKEDDSKTLTKKLIEINLKEEYIHITNKVNLNSILNNGLLSRNELQRKNIHFMSPTTFSESSKNYAEYKTKQFEEFDESYVRFGKLNEPTYKTWAEEDWLNEAIIFIANPKSQNFRTRHPSKRDELYKRSNVEITSSNIKMLIIQTTLEKIEKNQELIERIENEKGIKVINILPPSHFSNFILNDPIQKMMIWEIKHENNK